MRPTHNKAADPFDRRESAAKLPAILVVDDDVGTRDTFQWVLSKEGFDIKTARSGREALATASARRFDLLLVDLRLPDMLGTDLVRTMNVTTVMPFVLISAYLTTEITVEAMRLGAADVVEKPLTVDALRGLTSSFFGRCAVERHGTHDVPPVGDTSLIRFDEMPASNADRWAQYVVKACDSKKDLTTVRAWGVHVGASRTSISESCRLLGVDPHDARDLMRVLRALMRSRVENCPPDALLLVGDARTLRSLFERGGLNVGANAESVSIGQFLANQQFVDGSNEGVKALRRLLKLDPR